MKLLSSTALFTAFTLLAGAAHADVTLSVLIDNSPETVAAMDALTSAYSEKHPDISFDVEVRASGSEGDNLIKTRLATEEMSDLFNYNSGSLFQALKPERTLADLSDLPAQDNVLDSFKSVVTSSDGKLRGVPFGPGTGAGFFYSKPIYKELGLSIPKTWDEFMANGEKIKAAGKVVVEQTYGSSWTSQMLVLGDFYNVLAEAPDFAKDFTENKAKFATTPAALRSFEHLKDIHDAGFLNKDFGAATFDDGMRSVALGEAAHYPLLSFALTGVQQNYPDDVDNIGFFPIPGVDPSKNGVTVWMSNGLFIPSSAEHLEEAKEFANWAASPEGCNIWAKAVPTGPYFVKGCTLPDDVVAAVKDLLPYFEEDGKTAPALEFLSPLKGPALEQITVEVGSGIRSPEDGAALYDQDVEKQAKQLGLPNW